MAKSGKSGKLPRGWQRRSTDGLHELVQERESAFRDARRRVETAGQGRVPVEAERLRAEALAGARETTVELKALREELGRRQAAAGSGQAALRIAAAAAGVNSRFELDEHERARQEVRKQQLEQRERELAVRRAAVERRKRDELIAAGRIYVPVGGWDADAADALAAVVSSQFVWRCLERNGEPMPVLDAQHLAFLVVVLGVLAENGGEQVTLDLNRPFPHLPHDISRNRRDMLNHLADNGFVSLSKTKGSKVTIRRGPRTEELRESFQAQWRQRARPPSAAEEAMGWLADVKAWAAGLGKDKPSDEPEPA